MEVSEDSSLSETEPQKQQAATQANEESNINEEVAALDHDGDPDEIMDDEELNEKKSKTCGGFTGRGVTLQMLLEDNILQAKEGAMSLEYMGQKFNGDLLPDGKIFSAEVQEAFSSPSAWALRCKKIVNPEQKYGCGWSSVRYCGRPLDVYKNQWMRKRRLDQLGENPTADDCNVSISEPLALDQGSEAEPFIKIVSSGRTIVKHETLGNRVTIEDPNLLVETISFPSVGKLQPFLISLNTAALIVMDVHCSLTRSEVVGYLGGSWDMNSNTLTIKQAFPCLSRLGDGKLGHSIELKIAQSMESSGLFLVGWYHSHPCDPPTPTVQDIDSQLEYQLKLKGTGDYRPCVGFISSPFYRSDPGNTTLTDSLSCFWVSPPAEARPQELGRPMSMQYNLVYDSGIKEEVIPKLDACLNYYKDAPDRNNLEDRWMEQTTVLDKLRTSIKSYLQSSSDMSIVSVLEEFVRGNSKKTNLSSTPETSIPSSPSVKSPCANQSEVACV